MKKVTTKNVYESPVLEVTQVATEGTIAESGTFRVELDDWKQDDTAPAPYDGDIWLNL